MASKIKVGELAPDFTLPDEEGQPVSLQETLKAGPVMLVFYPGDFTPTCTKQLCDYRDQWSQFQEFGLQILGISDDPVDKHNKFRQAKSLPFPLLADPDRGAINLYSGTSLLAAGRANRSNYIITSDGVVRYVHVERIAITRRKSDDLLAALRKLRNAGTLS